MSASSKITGLQLKSWDYLECTYFYRIADASNGVTDMFMPYPFNATALAAACNKDFGLRRAGDTTFTTLEYGGPDVKGGTRIAVVNGQLDPTTGVAPWVPSTYREFTVIGPIPLAAHGLDVFPPTPLDPPDIVVARAAELALIRLWINETISESRKTL